MEITQNFFRALNQGRPTIRENKKRKYLRVILIPTLDISIGSTTNPLLQDDCGGVRESTVPGLYFVASADGSQAARSAAETQKPGALKCPSGTKWATVQEWKDWVKEKCTGSCKTTHEHVYYNQCGWTGQQYNGVTRGFFETRGHKCGAASNYDNAVQLYDCSDWLPYWGGIICLVSQETIISF